MTAKWDVKRELAEVYAPRNRDWALVEVPALRYLAVDGRGDPNTSARYVEAVEALYTVSYTAKFASKRELGRDYVVGPLEGLWWAEDMSAFRTRAKDEWSWRLLVHLPDWVGPDMVEAAQATAAAKGKSPTVADVRVEALAEGTCAQVLHVGSYDDEGPVLARLHEHYLPAHGLQEAGLHHEVYLSDPRRTAPERLRTILRQPVHPRAV